jgi:hypothetical protein
MHKLMYFAKVQSQWYLSLPLGAKILTSKKCTGGCSLVMFILLCIFGPLILFSSLNPSVKLNLVFVVIDYM